jgi:glutamate transport system substrate-binding protein
MGAACGSSNDDSPTVGGDGTATTVAKTTYPAGSTAAKVQARGKMIVGVKFDQPGFGQRNPTSGKIEGFDVEIAKLIAAPIFGVSAKDAYDKIEFVETVSAQREPKIQDGSVDLVIATYTINDTRKQVVDFAGPYFITHQDIMVKADDNTIKSVDDLKDLGKQVCSVNGSTSAKNLVAKGAAADLDGLTLFAGYSDCALALSNDQVKAVSTDAPILAGLVQSSNGAFKLLKAPFTDEPYGIGLMKGATDWRTLVNDRLEEIYASGEWANAFKSTLGAIGLDTPTPPKVDRYA